MPKNKPKIPDFDKIANDFFTGLSPHIAEKAKGFFKGGFFKEGFTDRAFVAWPKRKDILPHKILTKSQALRDSIEVTEATNMSIKIEAGRGIPYADIHNKGGIITKKDGTVIKIPQRKYIGNSQTLNKELQEYMIKHMKKFELKIKNDLK